MYESSFIQYFTQQGIQQGVQGRGITLIIFIFMKNEAPPTF